MGAADRERTDPLFGALLALLLVVIKKGYATRLRSVRLGYPWR